MSNPIHISFLDRLILKVQQIYHIKLIRVIFCLMRYWFFTLTKKVQKFKGDDDNLIRFDNGENTLEYNFKKIKHSIFFHDRVLNLIRPLLSLEKVIRDKPFNKILSIGPRSESELFLLLAHGFRWKNITALDLFSYTPKFDVGDMHEMPYKNNSFDIIISGWCLGYSENFKLALQEKIRVIKDSGIIVIGHGYKPEKKYQRIPNQIDKILMPIKSNINQIFFKHDISEEMARDGMRSVVVVFSVKK